MFRPPGPALVRVEQEDSLGEVGAGGVVAMALLNTVLMLATLATLGRSASSIQLSSHLLSFYIIDFTNPNEVKGTRKKKRILGGGSGPGHFPRFFSQKKIISCV